MSNSEENERNHPFPFIQFLVGPTPEQIERRHLEALSNAHEMQHFINVLDESELIKLIDLIKIVSSDDSAAFYYIGVLASKLDTDFGKCMSCGIKHDEQLAQIVGDGGAAEPQIVKHPNPLSPEYQTDVILYEVETDDDGSAKVMCKNCGKWYESLADRMLRPAGMEGCSGCVEKEKWG